MTKLACRTGSAAPVLRRRGLALAAVLAIGALSLGGCTRPIVEINGYMPAQDKIDSLRPGVQNVASVQRLLGSPSAITRFRSRVWLYVLQRTETVGFLEPEVVSRKVLELTFDENQILRDVQKYRLKDGKRIAFNEDKTVTRGKELTVLQQLFSNLGRFNTAKPDTGE